MTSSTVPSPVPPDSSDAWYAPTVRAQYELAPGVTATVHERDGEPESGLRADTDEYTRNRFTEANWDVLDEIRALAESKEATPAQVALAWLLHQEVVDAPIIGPRTSEHLQENVAAVSVDLTDEEAARIEGPKTPRWPAPGKN